MGLATLPGRPLEDFLGDFVGDLVVDFEGDLEGDFEGDFDRVLEFLGLTCESGDFFPLPRFAGDLDNGAFRGRDPFRLGVEGVSVIMVSVLLGIPSSTRSDWMCEVLRARGGIIDLNVEKSEFQRA
jgi:hypothetical protein